MFKPLPLFIGLRYTAAKRRNHFISFTSLISLVGLVLGVMVLIIVLSVMNGFDRELKQRILGMVPHAKITKVYGTITDWESLIKQMERSPRVISAAPFNNTQGMLTSNGRVQPVAIYGVAPEFERRVSIVNEHMRAGKLADLKPGHFDIVLGDIVARRLGAQVGDKVTLVLPDASVNPAGVFPRMKRFNVVGIFEVGAELDSSLSIIHYQDAAKLLRIKDGVQGIRLKMVDLFTAREDIGKLANTLHERYYYSDWTRTHGSLFQAIQMEKTMIGLLLTLIVAVAAFNIVSTLVMVVTDKQSDIAILRTFGASTKTIMGIFIVQGSVIGVSGTLLGVILGVLVGANVPEIVDWIEKTFEIQFLSGDVYFIDYLPSQLQWGDVGIITAAALSLSFLATLYPAYRASRTQPAEALRYE
ncbi:lipoprotein-releasing ABC transporter permease subunit [Zooshikella sp. RANM57]|uniref:lipoprotein-releasing ABC transporter permease subunit n=1 Tax=Zooshikella sp. RANM57 TaxID=3425863 RepID=UPI003D6FD1BA